MEDKLLSLNSNYVYETVPITDGVTPITSKPVFRIKHDHSGKIEWCKVCIVACGFTQKEAVDYQEVFAPMANLDSVQTIVALATSTTWNWMKWTSPQPTSTENWRRSYISYLCPEMQSNQDTAGNSDTPCMVLSKQDGHGTGLWTKSLENSDSLI